MTRVAAASTSNHPATTMTGNLLASTVRFLRATATNQLARLAPSYYFKLTKTTGRGASDVESDSDIAAYFLRCFDDYFRVLGVPAASVGRWLSGKVVLEYGPGDLPGMAILLVAHGVEKVFCVDRFPLLAASEKNHAAIEALLAHLGREERKRAADCFRERGNPRSGYSAHRVEYMIRDSGLSGLDGQVDLIISRAVLEHINSLERTFADMERALRPGAIAIHQVDLKSHGLHRKNPLDFLNWPPWMWNCMFSEKGAPNRWRVDKYRNVLNDTHLRTTLLQPTLRADPRDVSQARPHLARTFRDLSDEDLSWLGFWLVLEKAAQ